VLFTVRILSRDEFKGFKRLRRKSKVDLTIGVAGDIVVWKEKKIGRADRRWLSPGFRN
jgi:hypothetical protein